MSDLPAELWDTIVRQQPATYAAARSLSTASRLGAEHTLAETIYFLYRILQPAQYNVQGFLGTMLPEGSSPRPGIYPIINCYYGGEEMDWGDPEVDFSEGRYDYCHLEVRERQAVPLVDILYPALGEAARSLITLGRTTGFSVLETEYDPEEFNLNIYKTVLHREYKNLIELLLAFLSYLRDKGYNLFAMQNADLALGRWRRDPSYLPAMAYIKTYLEQRRPG